MSTTPTATPIGGVSRHSMNQNLGAQSASSRPTCSTSSVVPSKRSDDDIQFISSQPVKKQKLTQNTRLQIKITPPTTSQSTTAIWRQPQQHVINTSPRNHLPPLIVPSIQLTPAAPTFGGDQEQRTTNIEHSQERRVSTGMVGLPSDFHDVEAAYAIRGVSLPISTCFDNFVLNQPTGRIRPMSSPPLSPKQLPPPTMSFSVLHASTPPADMTNFHGIAPSAPQSSGDSNKKELPGTMAPMSTAHPDPAVLANRPLTPTSSPSPVLMMAAGKADTSMPPTSKQTIQHREQPPDMMKQAPPTSSQQAPTTAPAFSHPHGTKPPCPGCMAQRAMMARAQGLPVSMMNMQSNHTHTMPQMQCPPMQSYPSFPQQFMTMPGVSQGFHPMMMPMHLKGFNGMPQQDGGMYLHQQPLTMLQQRPEASSNILAAPVSDTPAEIRKDNPLNTAAPLASPTSPAKTHLAIGSTHRKPARNLIVDIAETCQERFPFEEVARRQNAPVAKVVEVYTAIIGVPLLRSANDRRRPGKTASNRLRDYQRAKKDIQEQGDRAEGGNRDEIAVNPHEIARHLGPLEMPEGSHMQV